MDRLRFVPRAGALPRWPNKGHGDMPYFGRSFERVEGKELAGRYVALDEPVSVKADSDNALRLIQLCKRDGDVMPADRATADAIGVRFQPITYDRAAREWVPAPAEDPAPKRTRKADD